MNLKRSRSTLLVLLLMLVSIVLAEDVALQIPAGNHQIPAIFSRPAGERPVPAVLFLHGFASTKDEVGDLYKRLAADLARNGIASLRFDFAGSGDSTQPFDVNTLDTQFLDAERAFAYLAAQKGIEPDRLGVVGFSLGGIIGTRLAAADPRVKVLALWSTPGDTPAAFADLYTANYARAVRQGRVKVDLGFRTVTLSRSFFESLYASYPLSDIRTYTHPLLVVAGGEDVPQPRYAREFIGNAASTTAELHILPGADHIYNALSEDQRPAETLLGLTVRFLTQTLPR